MLPKVFRPAYLRQLELLQLRSRKSFLGSRQGAHVSLKRGHGIEFSDYRKYELGDNPRHIDWGVYARSERLYVKRFQEEQALSLLIVCDGSPSMFYPEEEGKWSFAVELALSVGYVGFLQHDSVRVAVPGFFVSPGLSSPQAIHYLAELLQGVKPVEEESFISGCHEALAKTRFPSVALVISDFLFPLEDSIKALNAFRARNVDIHCVQVLGSQDRDPFQSQAEYLAVDSESGKELELSRQGEAEKKYQKLLHEHCHGLEDFCRKHGISYRLAESEEDLEKFVVKELAQAQGVLAA